MKLSFETWVEPVEVVAGVPFPPCTMYAVKHGLVADGRRDDMHGACEVYWTRAVANRIAVEKARVYGASLRQQIEEMMHG